MDLLLVIDLWLVMVNTCYISNGATLDKNL